MQTADDIDSLVARMEEAAGKAPAGPWERKRREGKHFRLVDGPNNETIAWVGHGNNEKADAISSHIAAANPANILSLCAAFKAVKGERDKAKAILAQCGIAAGAAVSAECSLEFMNHIPNEIRLCLAKKQPCSLIADDPPQYVKDAVRGAQVAPDEIG